VAFTVALEALMAALALAFTAAVVAEAVLFTTLETVDAALVALAVALAVLLTAAPAPICASAALNDRTPRIRTDVFIKVFIVVDFGLIMMITTQNFSSTVPKFFFNRGDRQ